MQRRSSGGGQPGGAPYTQTPSPDPYFPPQQGYYNQPYGGAQPYQPGQQIPSGAGGYFPQPTMPGGDWSGQYMDPSQQPYGQAPPQPMMPRQPSMGGGQIPPPGLPADMFNNPAAQMGLHFGKRFMDDNVGWLLNFLSIHKLKYYFAVNNAYVKNKLRVLLCPLLHKNWKRERIEGMEHVDPNAPGMASTPLYKAPRDDINAPDLYIPTMAFITYILLIGYALGRANEFHPEVLVGTASSTMVTLILEVLLMKAGFYIIGANVPSPKILDLIAYSAYKYVGLIIEVFIGLTTITIWGSWPFYISILILGSFMGLFMMRTMKRVFTPTIDAHTLNVNTHSARRNYFLLFIGLMQLIISFFLARPAIRHAFIQSTTSYTTHTSTGVTSVPVVSNTVTA